MYVAMEPLSELLELDRNTGWCHDYPPARAAGLSKFDTLDGIGHKRK